MRGSHPPYIQTNIYNIVNWNALPQWGVDNLPGTASSICSYSQCRLLSVVVHVYNLLFIYKVAFTIKVK